MKILVVPLLVAFGALAAAVIGDEVRIYRHFIAACRAGGESAAMCQQRYRQGYDAPVVDLDRALK